MSPFMRAESAEAWNRGILYRETISYPCCRWPTLDDCRTAIKEEQQQLCDYIETIRFKLDKDLADKLQAAGAIQLPDEEIMSQ